MRCSCITQGDDLHRQESFGCIYYLPGIPCLYLFVMVFIQNIIHSCLSALCQALLSVSRRAVNKTDKYRRKSFLSWTLHFDFRRTSYDSKKLTCENITSGDLFLSCHLLYHRHFRFIDCRVNSL